MTFTRRYIIAVFWPSALTGTAGHWLTNAVSRPMGLTNTTWAFVANKTYLVNIIQHQDVRYVGVTTSEHPYH